MCPVLITDYCCYCDLVEHARSTTVVCFGEFGIETLESTLGDTRHLTKPCGGRNQQDVCIVYLCPNSRPLIAPAHVDFHSGSNVMVHESN